MEPTTFALGCLAAVAAILGIVLGLFALHGYFVQRAVAQEARAGAAELAQESDRRQVAEALAADRLTKINQLLAERIERAAADSEAEERAQERDSLRRDAGSDADHADRLLDHFDPGGKAPASSPSGEEGQAGHLG